MKNLFDLNFKIAFDHLLNRLHSLINVNINQDFSLEPPFSISAIEEDLYLLTDCHRKGLYRERRVVFAKLERLIENLTVIRSHDKKSYNRWKERYKSGSNINNYGDRFEAAIWSELINQKYQFEKSESPDFKITFNNENVFIECTSRRRPELNGDMGKYIFTAINGKDKKPYMNNKTALFVDVTNLFYRAIKGEGLPTPARMKEVAEIGLNTTINIGSIFIFSFLWNEELHEYELPYIRRDRNDIDKALKDFLDQFQPFGVYKVPHFIVPIEG